MTDTEKPDARLEDMRIEMRQDREWIEKILVDRADQETEISRLRDKCEDVSYRKFLAFMAGVAAGLLLTYAIVGSPM